MRISAKVSKKFFGMVIRSRKSILNDGVMTTSGIGEPNVYHALVVIFLEFFAWGLLTMPIIAVLNETFPDHTFLMNGIIMGIKGFLSFLSAPLIGALSDVWGRKFFLLITVFFTCAPIPLMTVNTWWFFAMISISGIFAVTFSVVFAYVADVTEESERSLAYGLKLYRFILKISLVIGFSVFNVAVYIAVIGILSVVAQTVLCILMRSLGPKRTIMVGLLFEMLQLMWYGFGSQYWMMWAAGVLASISSITYPAISAFVSLHSEADKQGLVQGMVTGMRGLCNGLGPAMFGVIFYLFHVDLDDKPVDHYQMTNKTVGIIENAPKMIPGPPFVFGAMLVMCALLVAEFIPSDLNTTSLKAVSRRQSGLSVEVHYEIEKLKKHDGGVVGPLTSLVDHNSVVL
ncbi:Hippocampus abundant transcript 1 protein, putative [Pediculus humanus corporis]|uniref:Hippocampus abundant transcript 1 protein, putative n=1 Tax=Pediculus humanus subsp. corporis TaxID=121224 RepID=E0VFF2_PEDHC|nr:Hippocampus abundant transcript 1 protein, putative [Pediculus humanus corporis]EEB12108.1 Hippocampus abundant transcript 1 protein, putative [Pediculus humanus corporis]